MDHSYSKPALLSLIVLVQLLFPVMGNKQNGDRLPELLCHFQPGAPLLQLETGLFLVKSLLWGTLINFPHKWFLICNYVIKYAHKQAGPWQRVMGYGNILNTIWSHNHLFWSPIFRVENYTLMAVWRLTASQMWNSMSQGLWHKQMYKNSIVLLFAKSDRVTGLSARQRVQSTRFVAFWKWSVKKYGFVYKC